MLDWNYTTAENLIADPQYQAFNATLRTKEYMSGGQHRWQGMFYIVLATVFVTNLFCLVYFAISGSHITDFFEAQNLFPLSLNSPPSAVLNGSCGGGLEKEQLSASWRIMQDQERQHLYIESRGEQKEVRKRSFSQQKNFEMESMLGKLGSRKRMSRL